MITPNQYRILKEIHDGREPTILTGQDISDMIWLLEHKMIEPKSCAAVKQLYDAAETLEDERNQNGEQSPDDHSYDLHPAVLYAVGFLCFTLLHFIFKFF